MGRFGYLGKPELLQGLPFPRLFLDLYTCTYVNDCTI